MRSFLFALSFGVLLAAGHPAGAQGDDAPSGTLDERFGELVDRLLERLEPGMNELRELLGDMSGWHMPEVLPNGDILIRRRAPIQPAPDSAPSTEGEAGEPFEL